MTTHNVATTVIAMLSGTFILVFDVTHTSHPVFLYRFFIIALVSMVTIGVQNFMFASSAADLTNKLRGLSFRAILRQDSEYLTWLAQVNNRR